ncbi:MAG: PAS domain S-box protein [Deltaproteobacteria bacterium]|nr:PAS domain S-box protein [Deltaproteobacteria bacterium]
MMWDKGVRDQLAQYKYALDQASIVAITDVRGKIIFANDKFCEISKYQREELLGQDHRILNSGFHPPSYVRELWRTIAQGRVWRGELRNRAKDGSIYWVDTTIVPLLGEDDKPVQYLSIRIDVTERKHIEAQLRAKETMAQLGQMAAVIAHEVKNPLAGISGTIQVIAKRFPAESAEANILHELVLRVASLNEVLGGLLEFARPPTPRIRTCTAREVADQAKNYLRDHPDFGRIDFGIEVTSLASTSPVAVDVEDVTFVADPPMLARALLNLVINAAQALEGTAAPVIRIEISERRSTGRNGHPHRDVVIAVVDNGPGVQPEVIPDLFKPFVTTKIAGTGLGLAVVKQTVEAHGGRIEVVSWPGRTAFEIILPADGSR